MSQGFYNDSTLDAIPASTPASAPFSLAESEPPSSPVSSGKLRDAARVFNVCHVGVVLRAVLLVHGALAVGVMFNSYSLLDWLVRAALVGMVALPSVLVWCWWPVPCGGRSRPCPGRPSGWLRVALAGWLQIRADSLGSAQAAAGSPSCSRAFGRNFLFNTLNKALSPSAPTRRCACF